MPTPGTLPQGWGVVPLWGASSPWRGRGASAGHCCRGYVLRLPDRGRGRGHSQRGALITNGEERDK